MPSKKDKEKDKGKGTAGSTSGAGAGTSGAAGSAPKDEKDKRTFPQWGVLLKQAGSAAGAMVDQGIPADKLVTREEYDKAVKKYRGK